MINKKLFETVMGFKVVEFEQNINTIRYYPASYPRAKCIDWKPDLISINIYELANKCKEWVAHKGYILTVETSMTQNLCLISLDKISQVYYGSETEPEAVFKATQWVLENDSKQADKS